MHLLCYQDVFNTLLININYFRFFLYLIVLYLIVLYLFSYYFSSDIYKYKLRYRNLPKNKISIDLLIFYQI